MQPHYHGCGKIDGFMVTCDESSITMSKLPMAIIERGVKVGFKWGLKAIPHRPEPLCIKEFQEIQWGIAFF